MRRNAKRISGHRKDPAGPSLASGIRRLCTKPFVKLVFQTPAEASHFFGYYDKSPLDRTQRHLLAHCVDFDGRNIGVDDRAEVGYFDLGTGEWHVVGETAAFNWQQGAMLQWLGPDYQSRVIYNDQSGDSYVSIVVDLESGKKRTVPSPIYAVHPSGKTAIAVNFKRHFFCRAYHYEGIRNEKWNCPIHPDDGLFKVDLEHGSSELIIKTEEIALIDPLPVMAGTSHWLEHVMWNPSGTRFAFLHRFGHGEDFKTRIYTAGSAGENLYRFPDMAVVSHMAWRNDTEFVVWAKPEATLSNVYSRAVERRSLASAMFVGTYRWAKKHLLPQRVTNGLNRGGAAYLLMRDGAPGWQRVGFNVLTEDGHPSWTRNGRFMLTDTYADAAGYRHLLLYDTIEDRVHRLGRFFSPYNNSGFRCDLHPRLGPGERHIVLDTAHSDRRQMLVLEVEWDKIIQNEFQV